MGILIRERGGDWQEPVMGYDSEKALQAIIHEHPSLVTGSLPGQADTVIACRELEGGVGPADVVVLDASGNLTLVECKLARNPEVRRKVIGQVLDYASRIWQMDADEFALAWAKASGGVSPFEALEDEDGLIRAAVAENLAAARFRIVLAVDGINDDLRRIVEFLNRITVPETGVIALELERASAGGTEVLIPTTFGTDFVEAKAAADPVARRARWSQEQFFEWCEENDPAGGPLARRLVTALLGRGFILEGGNGQRPSVNFGLTTAAYGLRWPVGIAARKDGVTVEIRFSDYKAIPELRDALAEAVESIPGIPVPVAQVRELGFEKRPSIPIRDFTPAHIDALPGAVARAFERAAADVQQA
ncbi:hypothetical protein [Sinomonas sp.]|uniref:hypothetical protein n=1 Tax=Sinomonas sp. TaxID=1914986 RepID=UPI003F7F70C3